jgi:1-acyl-sn-glycerol-3-phosphate acyltransferase
MKFFEFIFLKRRLEHDKDNITQNLETSKKRGRPMWLVLFPEGTGKQLMKKRILCPMKT